MNKGVRSQGEQRRHGRILHRKKGKMKCGPRTLTTANFADRCIHAKEPTDA